VIAPASLDDLPALAASLRDEPPGVIAVHGGDGTLHKVVSALGAAFGEQPLPPIAVLTGGTMNVVATSLGLREDPKVFLRTLAEDARAGRPSEVVQRRCMRIGDQLGFVFGSGLPRTSWASTTAARLRPGRAAWLLMGTFSGAGRGPLVRRIFKRFEGEVRVDGTVLPHPLHRRQRRDGA
jgi:diacylglycerol kinase family enzyme